MIAEAHPNVAPQFGDAGRRSIDFTQADGKFGVGSSATVASSLSDRLALISTLNLADLRLEWRRLYRADPPRLSRDIMVRAIAYRLQEVAHGGLSKATKRRLATLTAEFESSGTIGKPEAPRIKAGSRLVRDWHGRTHVVTVTEDGFEFEGATYKSLTKIARDITGARWSGPRFFGLAKAAAAGMGAGTVNEDVGEELASAEGVNG